MAATHTRLDPKTAALRGRIGGFTTASRMNGAEMTARARESFLARFEAEVDPDGELAPEERQRRAELLRRAHFARLQQRSAESRRKKTNGAGSDRTNVLSIRKARG